MRKLCVLRSGGDFKPEHVDRLARMVPGLECLTDMKVGIPSIPLKHNWPGWWSKMQIFRPDIEGDIFYLDLDTTVHRLPPMPDKTTVLTDFYHPDLIGSGLMYIKQEDKAQIWDHFTQDPESIMADYTKWPYFGDQGYLMQFLSGAARWGSNVQSYKVHGFNPEADITCFHGKPRPWDVGL